MKTEVYSWRLSSNLKTTLEREARRRGKPVSVILDQAAKAWLESVGDDSDDRQQEILHRTVSKHIGVIRSGHQSRSENVRQTVRARLMRKNGR